MIKQRPDDRVHNFSEVAVGYDEETALSLDGLEIVRLGRREVVVVAVELLAHREQKKKLLKNYRHH
jgi:hypothetical protein